MANRDFPGMYPINNPAGTAARVRHYAVSSSYATAIGEGCLVVLNGATGVRVHDVTSTTQVKGNILGVAAHYVKASPGVGATIAVYDDPEQEFIIQGDVNDLTTAAACEAVVGHGAPVVTNTCNTTTGRAKTELDTSAISSIILAGTFQLQIIDFWDAEENDPTVINEKYIVKIRHGAHLFHSNYLTVSEATA